MNILQDWFNQQMNGYGRTFKVYSVAIRNDPELTDHDADCLPTAW